MFCELKDKHSGKFSVPQLRLWARMVASGIHDDLGGTPTSSHDNWNHTKAKKEMLQVYGRWGLQVRSRASTVAS